MFAAKADPASAFKNPAVISHEDGIRLQCEGKIQAVIDCSACTDRERQGRRDQRDGLGELNGRRKEHCQLLVGKACIHQPGSDFPPERVRYLHRQEIRRQEGVCISSQAPCHVRPLLEDKPLDRHAGVDDVPRQRSRSSIMPGVLLGRTFPPNCARPWSMS